MSVQTCADCRRDYPRSPGDHRQRGPAAATLYPPCQVAAAHDAWPNATRIAPRAA